MIVKSVPSSWKLPFPSIDAEKYNCSLSISLPDKVVLNTPSSSILWSATSSRTGASFTGFTVTVNVVESEYSPSVTSTDKERVPNQSASGITVRLVPSTSTAALPSTDAEKIKSSPSISDADNSRVTLPSSSISWLSTDVIIGASFTGFTVNVNDIESSSSISVTLTETTISPYQSWLGVIVKLVPLTKTSELPSEVALKYKFSLSTSDALSTYSKTPSSSILWSATSSRTGASFTGFTVTVNVVESVYSPSVTSTDKERVPNQSASGVTVRLVPSTSTAALPSTDVEKIKSSPSTS